MNIYPLYMEVQNLIKRFWFNYNTTGLYSRLRHKSWWLLVQFATGILTDKSVRDQLWTNEYYKPIKNHISHFVNPID